MKDSLYTKRFKSYPGSPFSRSQMKSGRSGAWINPRVITLGIAFCLFGCMGVYEGGFECPPGEGVGCKSISEVNEMVNQGLGYKSSETKEQKSESKRLDEPKNKVCGKDQTCPINPDLPDIWDAPRGVMDELLLEA